jgi:toxin ParE1/3/4
MPVAKGVVWSPEAEQDLLDIWLYTAEHASPDTADEQLHLVESVCDQIAEWPEAGRARDELLTGLRSIVAGTYVVFYRIYSRQLQIVRVLHGRRDIDAIFSL